MATAAKIPQIAWNKVRPAPVVLVSGTESFLAERAFRSQGDQRKTVDPSREIHDLEAAP